MSLFDTIMDGVDTPNDNTTLNTQLDNRGMDGATGPAWWWDKGTPGTGDRPEWLPSKFKTVEDAARAFSELEKRLGSAPDQYDFSKAEKWIDADFDSFKEMAAFAKSKHVPQEVMDKMLESVGSYLDAFTVDTNSEKLALGENAEDRLRVLNNWAKSNFTDETYKALTSNLRTADAVKAIEEMREKMIQNNTTIPTGNETSTPVLTVQEVQMELEQNLDKYQSDPNYRKEIQRKIALASELQG